MFSDRCVFVCLVYEIVLLCVSTGFVIGRSESCGFSPLRVRSTNMLIHLEAVYVLELRTTGAYAGCGA